MRRVLLEVALFFGTRRFRDEYRRNFYSDVSAVGPTIREAFDVARAGIGVRLEELIRDLRIAGRSLAKMPLVAAIAIVTLGLAISVNAAVFGAIDGILLKPLPFAGVDRLAFVCKGSTQSHDCGGQLPNWLIGNLEENSRAFDGIAAWQFMSYTLTGFGAPKSLNAAWVSSNFFDVLRTRAELGRTFTQRDADPGATNVVISDALWRHEFNRDPHIIGRYLHLDGSPVRVAGVAPPGFTVPDLTDAPGMERFDIFTVLPYASFHGPRPWLNDYVFTRLAARSGLGVANRELNRLLSLAQHQNPTLSRALHLDVQPFTTFYYSRARTVLYLALAAVLAVLLIACANVANLLLLRGSSRGGEIAVRSALGATRARIMQQLCAELFLIALSGLSLGLLLSVFEMRALVALNPSGVLPRVSAAHLNLHVAALTFLVTLIATCGAGVAPAFIATRRDLQSALKSSGRNAQASTAHTLRSVLVVTQVALAFAVIAACGLLYRSCAVLSGGEDGLNTRHVYVADVGLFSKRFSADVSRANFIAKTVARVRAIPGVADAAIARPVPETNMGGEYFDVRLPADNYAQGSQPSAVVTPVTPDFFRVLSIPLVEGRSFTAGDTAASARVAIVERAFARQFFPGRDPIGKQILVQGGAGFTAATIVGVAGDVNQHGRFGSLHAVYVPELQSPSEIVQIAIRTNHAIPNLSAEVATAVASADPQQAVQGLYSLQDLIDSRTAPLRTSAILVGIFAAIALLLALGGVYSIVSYAVERRHHEIGIRMALGARSARVMSNVLASSLRIASLGVMLGVVFCAFETRLFSGLPISVPLYDPETFAAVIAILLLSVTLASSIPALRAARLQPAVALRYE